MERVYEDCGAHPRRRGAKKIVSYIRPDDPRACAYDWRYYYEETGLSPDEVRAMLDEKNG